MGCFYSLLLFMGKAKGEKHFEIGVFLAEQKVIGEITLSQ
jgi:hypothetical protein